GDGQVPWSGWGYTEYGFSKPEVGAPGRRVIGPVPRNATLVSEKPDRVVQPGYMELSGTSFAAPVVAGSAAVILSRHPGWTPDQVKGALMLFAQPALGATPTALGVGDVSAYRSARYLRTPPNPNSA